MKKLALIGSRDLAEQIQVFVTREKKYEVVGFFDDFLKPGTIIRGLPVLGNISSVEDNYQEGVFDYVFMAVGYNNFLFREKVFSSLKGKVPFANIVMSNVTIRENVKLGEGIFIGNNSLIGINSVIEDNVFIHNDTLIAHDNFVGAHSYISGRVDTAGFCKIGKRNFIGVRTLLSDHIEICDDVWVGLGCIVAKNINNPGKYMSPCTKLYKIE